MPADREACLAAGMNEHVGKPFEFDALVGLLRRLTGRQAEAAAPTDALAGDGCDRPPSSNPLPATLVDAALAAGVDLERALARLGGKRHLYERLLRSFVNDLAGLHAQLQAQLAAGDAETASRALHTLKGLAGTLGASALSATADQGLRALAAAATPTAPSTATEPVAAALAAVLPVTAAIDAAGPRLLWLLQALQSEQATIAAPAGGAGIDPGTEAVALQELAALLENSDMRATEVMAELLHQPGSDRGAPWRALGDAIDSLDFERALRLCRSLLTEAVA
jgi:HPt (histidine-containing phosphotransfer) domain-containing protein